MYEKRGSADIYYFYDSYGHFAAFKYCDGSTEYLMYAVTNSQGDVLGLYTGSGVCYVKYEYDAWGNVTETNAAGGALAGGYKTISDINPFRYRGYYYDADFGLYYLQSRYYDPEIGRFLNADGYLTTGQGILSYNMFAYCGNNPVNRADPSGKLWGIVLTIALLVVAVAVDHHLAKRNPDGVAFKEEKVNTETANINSKVLYAKGSGAKADKNGATLCDLEAGVWKSETAYDNAKFSLYNFATAEVKSEIDWSGSFECSAKAVAAAYTASGSYSFDLGFASVEVSADIYLGSASAGIEWDTDDAIIKITPPSLGAGYSYGVDFDVK